MMFPASIRSLGFAALLVFSAVVRCAWADSPIPDSILHPKSAAEAWNTIRLATKNIDQLLEENRVKEIGVQVSYCAPPMRALPRLLADTATSAAVGGQVERAFVSLEAIATASRQGNPVGAKLALEQLRRVLAGAASHFEPKAVDADIFFCPMHSDFLAEKVETPCAKCGMNLMKRRIPYSFIYTKPGEASVRISAMPSGLVEAGKRLDVMVRLEREDKSPVVLADLIVMHTEPIHLLIEEPGLGDYHHEHPVPTDTPGEYTFSFTPRKTSPYRIWADIVPVATGIQELPFVDLPSDGQPAVLKIAENQFRSSVKGFEFELSFTDGNPLPNKAGQTRNMLITIRHADGTPVTGLEPVMNAFAHLVGFYDDYHTVVHLHPTGGDVTDEKARGGPALGFILFPPKPGFIRLYCQVSIGGKMLFAPFNLNIEP